MFRKIFFLVCLSLGVIQVSAASALQPLTVILDWFVNPDHAPLFVAEQQGYFKQQGLDVKFIAPADPSDPPKLVAAGKADIAIDYQPHLLLAIAQGLPLVQMGTLIQTPLSCLAVLQESSIKTIADLRGKRIGYSGGGVDSAELQGMLQHNNMSFKDVELIDVKYNLAQALLSKQVDAVIGVMRNFELIQFALNGHPARCFYPEENGVPPYNELIFITNQNQKNDPRLQKFLQAVALGVQYLRQHPEPTWQVFAKNHPELNNELNHRAWLATLPHFAVDPQKTDPQQCRNLSNYLQKILQVKIPAEAC
jgi:putative hydroxymethylpyrimidine transport system substrate-binding protein